MYVRVSSNNYIYARECMTDPACNDDITKKASIESVSGQSLRLLPYQLFLFIYPERDKKKNLPVSQIYVQ
jgi:hypothetical protein